MRIYHNGGNTNQLYPNYATPVDTVAAGVETWTSGPLCAGVWVFGFRVYDGTNEEPNTSILQVIRVGDDGLEITASPPRPFLSAFVSAGGKIALQAHALPITDAGVTAKFKFFTNDGAGGAVDYTTPLGAGFYDAIQAGPYMSAAMLSPEYGETARKFGCIGYTTDDVPSLNADELTITPISAVPPQPQSPAAAAGRI